jgi:Tfp pilus tip-associated adhesin PilY1
VKAFEDGFNDKVRKLDKERAAQAAQNKAPENPDRYLGAELCVRCHQDEGAQWKTTAHSIAWQTLVDAKKESTPECVGCHVVGYRKPGGFQAAMDSTKLGNVQCENCHGMGTMHEALASPHAVVAEQVCQSCHQGEHDPEWNMKLKLPRIVHSNLSGESMRTLQHNSKMMKGSTP